ncbi:MAG: hypothetical protein K9N09_01320 [Candidatus Cloacimonetes bacterium]|nr:hypothetical protein [Candidatus Cloacimonadota bacterium]MCF7815234.1 hypothetical protein [Candidatus Cloacimonadota bacterium]MCF7867313.1 hypothetical protein [Candidatus Cloacimonadota bacterium]MCF7884703.1 hypothetical protein [Candidatus Cloacimonadota bacterium]
MKTLKGLYLEEVEFVLENMARNAKVSVKREAGNQASFSVYFEDDNLYKKIEDMLYFTQKDYGYDSDYNYKHSNYLDDDDDED